MKTENLLFDPKGDSESLYLLELGKDEISISLLAPCDLNGSSVCTAFVPPLTIKAPRKQGL